MPPTIIRLRTENNLFQHLEVLKHNRNTRHRSREFFVEGVKSINQAALNRWPIRVLVYPAGRRLSGWAQETLAGAGAASLIEIDPHLMEKLSDKEEASELIAVVGIPDDTAERIRLGDGALVAVFDRPTSPGNLGSIIRSCDALGADGLIVTGHGADVYDPLTVRASMGSLFALPVVRLASHVAVQQWVTEVAVSRGPVRIVGGSGDAERALDDVDLTVPTVLVLGNETTGLSGGYRELCDVLVRIPMYGAADSLNVACAASIMLYEVARQRCTAQRRTAGRVDAAHRR